MKTDRRRRVARVDLLSSPRLTPELKELLAEPYRDRDGYLYVEGFASRTGIQVYDDHDRGLLREYRPPEEVHHRDSLVTWAGSAVTKGHPPKFVTIASDSAYRRGAILSVEAFENHGLNKVRLVVTDASLITAIENGLEELSMGYSAAVVFEEGTVPDSDPIHAGERYDAIQRVIEINHCAVVDAGRAGPVGRLRLDADGHVQLGTQTPRRNTVKIQIGNATYDIDDSAAEALLAERSAHADSLATAQKQAADAQGEVKVIRAELEKRPTEDALRQKLDAAARERAQLLSDADPYLPEKYDSSEKSTADIQRDALNNHYPGDGWDKADAALLPGAFQVMVKASAAAKKKSDGLRSAVQNAGNGDPESQLTDKRQKERQALADQYNWNSAKGTNGRDANA